jgi:hypothetical protein
LTVYAPTAAGAVHVVGFVVVDEKVPALGSKSLEAVQAYEAIVPSLSVAVAVSVTGTPPRTFPNGDLVIEEQTGGAFDLTVISNLHQSDAAPRPSTATALNMYDSPPVPVGAVHVFRESHVLLPPCNVHPMFVTGAEDVYKKVPPTGVAHQLKWSTK